MAFSLVGSSEPIEIACHRSRTTRSLLIVLCSLIDRRQRFRPIYAGREWLCQTAQISDRSLTTAISRLVEAGVIASRKVLRDAQGRFSRLCITFSAEAIFSFFPDAIVADGDSKNDAPIQGLSDVSRTPPVSLISNKDTGCAVDSEKQGSSRGPQKLSDHQSLDVTHRENDSVKRFRVPRTLTPLLRAGVSVPGLFSLMTFARERNQRLEDVVSSVAPKLRDGLIQYPYAYIKRCLFVDRDYAVAGSQAAARAAAMVRKDYRGERFRALSGCDLLADDGAKWTVDGHYLYREPKAGTKEAPSSLYANPDIVKRVLDLLDTQKWILIPAPESCDPPPNSPPSSADRSKDFGYQNLSH